MNIATELAKFTAHAKKCRMNTSGDKGRWFNSKTARAWTAWLTKARG
jgi:hypothetical protein